MVGWRVGLAFLNMSEYIDLGDEFDFVWSFEEPRDVFDYLLELHDEFELQDITQMKQAFLNQERYFYYMECVRFEETYLR